MAKMSKFQQQPRETLLDAARRAHSDAQAVGEGYVFLIVSDPSIPEGIPLLILPEDDPGVHESRSYCPTALGETWLRRFDYLLRNRGLILDLGHVHSVTPELAERVNAWAKNRERVLEYVGARLHDPNGQSHYVIIACSTPITVEELVDRFNEAYQLAASAVPKRQADVSPEDKPALSWDQVPETVQKMVLAELGKVRANALATSLAERAKTTLMLASMQDFATSLGNIGTQINDGLGGSMLGAGSAFDATYLAAIDAAIAKLKKPQ